MWGRWKAVFHSVIHDSISVVALGFLVLLVLGIVGVILLLVFALFILILVGVFGLFDMIFIWLKSEAFEFRVARKEDFSHVLFGVHIVRSQFVWVMSEVTFIAIMAASNFFQVETRVQLEKMGELALNHEDLISFHMRSLWLLLHISPFPLRTFDLLLRIVHLIRVSRRLIPLFIYFLVQIVLAVVIDCTCSCSSRGGSRCRTWSLEKSRVLTTTTNVLIHLLNILMFSLWVENLLSLGWWDCHLGWKWFLQKLLIPCGWVLWLRLLLYSRLNGVVHTLRWSVQIVLVEAAWRHLWLDSSEILSVDLVEEDGIVAVLGDLGDRNSNLLHDISHTLLPWT